MQKKRLMGSRVTGGGGCGLCDKGKCLGGGDI